VNTLLLGDLTACLQLAGAWLDPMAIVADEPYAEEDYMLVLRERFPEQYAEFWRLVYEGQSGVNVEMTITNEINERIPYGEFIDLDFLPWGPPVPFLGSGLSNNGYEDVDDIWSTSRGAEVGRLFLLDDPANDNYAFKAHALIAEAVDDELTCVLTWIFGSSGNTLFDWTEWEAGESGLEHPGWEGMESTIPVYTEACELHDRAMNGFEALEEDDDLYGQVCGDIIRAYWQSIEEVHYVRYDRPAFQRVGIGLPVDSGTADPEPDLHAVRDRAA